jgi:hypothetical protein
MIAAGSGPLFADRGMRVMLNVLSRSRVSAQPAAGGAQWTQLYLGLGFTTLATLLLELALTRLFSVVFLYHFAFLAISLALFGLGAGGVFSYVIANRPGKLSAELGRLSFVNSVVIVLLLWFVLSRHGEMDLPTLLSVYAASSVPFFFAGAVVSLAIGEAIDRVDRAYCFDLAGAAAGCLLLVPFLNAFGGPNTILASGVMYGVASSIWFNRAGEAKLRALAVLVALVLVTLMVVNGANHMFDVRWAKGKELPQERFTGWNSFSRVGLARENTKYGSYWQIRIDADAATGIPTLDWARGLTPDDRNGLLHHGAGLPYLIRPGAKTLIIGSGGGFDVARALASGSQDVTAVEINPIIANTIMRDRMLKESGGLYTLPQVRVHVEDGRSFVRRSRERYQVVQATLVDTWASTAAGAFALSENNLYTTEAFVDYLSHLTSDGLLAFSRWGFEPPRESLRLVTLAREALARLGEREAARHILAVRQSVETLEFFGALDTVLVARKPFTEPDLAAARAAIARIGLTPIYLPGDAPSNEFGQYLTSPDPERFLRSYTYDVSAVSDDRPFFFYTVQARDLLAFALAPRGRSADYKLNSAIPTVFALMAVSLIATILVMALPRLVLGARLPKQKGVLAFLPYFLFLGAGYILVQVALIQRFILLLGNPTYALFAIVFAMLVSSGLGSLASGRVCGSADRRLMAVLAAVAALIAGLAAIASPLVSAAAAWPVPLKLLITVASIAPAAFLMGMPFPCGLRRMERRHSPSVRWAWSLNAAASVLGSVSAVLLAIYMGLRATLLAGAMCYLCALLVIAATRPARAV